MTTLTPADRQRLRDWYVREVGYDPMTDDASMTDADLVEMCSGFATEAGIADPTTVSNRLAAIASHLGRSHLSADNPSGAVAFHITGNSHDWVIMDPHAHKTFATFENAIAGAKTWQRAFAIAAD